MSAGATTAVVVDDSQFMRTTISEILEADGISVLAEAKDGDAGVDAVLEHEPDVVTMDVEMPGTNGIEAVERIMDRRATPILMLSAHTGEDADVTFEALDRGAVDFFEKPRGEVSVGLSHSEEQLIETVRSVAAATPTVATTTDAPDAPGQISTRRRSLPDRPTLVIGASTGGPTVVERLLSTLPDGVFRVLITQHMPESFTEGFAERLDRKSDYQVRQAEDGDRIVAGEALVAPGSHHMEVSGYHDGRLRIGLTDPSEGGVTPSIDVTMRSAADQIDDPLVGVILTGMGDDGSAGVTALDAANGSVLAQDEETSAVFGMPARAIETGAVDLVRPAGGLVEGVLEILDSKATVDTTEVSSEHD